ncbi:MAG: hypothetical protein OP8BY_2202 [Candidatus Saccharicenans subterraneus]|uniref:Uncharacterized protein n=1 Tax=Candidatus Saccharicenans subterraneus TaxID=2508984 RepID=A0A3E2BM75_9BACT|nr:MAG: hypothetical protein OP8BY_2202 [Candidatus Saccharicenans subterraneum]
MAIFSLIMIDSHLPSRICQARAKIREMASRFDESHGSGRSGARTGSERTEMGSWLDRFAPLAEPFKPGHKKSFELLWLVEELAAGLPRTTLRAVVWWGVIVPVLKKAGPGQVWVELPPVAWASAEKPALGYNHLFLPPPASRTFKLLGTGMVGSSWAEGDPGQHFPVFDLPAEKRILIPAVSFSESMTGKTGAGVLYYLVEDERLSFEPCPVVKWYFPFRPAMCRKTWDRVSSWKIEPILSVSAEEFQTRLEAYFLLLAAVFSGWARAGWQGLVRRKRAGNFSPELDTEISFLATEIGRLQHGLFHLSLSRFIPGGCYSRKVEKLCLKGLHLASRAWRHWPAPGRAKNLFTGEGT